MTTTLLSAATAAVVVLAVTATGFPVNHVSANDGGVWITNDNPGSGNQGSFGEFNVPDAELGSHFGDPGPFQSAYNLDLRQSGTTVLAIDYNRGVAYPVGEAAGTANGSGGATFAPDGQIALGGGVVAILDPSTSGTAHAWASEIGAGTSASLTGLGVGNKPLASIKGGDALAVDDAGDVYIASRTELITLPSIRGALGPAVVTRFDNPLSAVSLTTIGRVPVILDAAENVVLFPKSGATTTLPASADDGSAVLQQSGPAASSVLVASKTALYQVPLGGAAPTTLATAPSGQPAQPVRLDGCAYAAWAGTPGHTAESCPGSTLRDAALPTAPGGSGILTDPVFRVNNNEILLNDAENGEVWTVAGAVSQVLTTEDWLRVLSGDKPKQNNDTKNHYREELQAKRAPKLKNPTLYAKPGRDSILHLLDDDTDPGGSVLSIVNVTPASGSDFSLQVSPDTQTVAIDLASGVTSPVEFDYSVVDGFGLTASGPVTVLPTTADQSPYQLPGVVVPTLHVVSGGTVNLQVLGNWRSPQNSPLSVAQASAAAGQITWTSDGLLTYSAPVYPTDQPVTIDYTVTDGTSTAVTGQRTFIILGRGDTTAYPPTGVPDAVKVLVGRPASVSPLANDLFGADPNHPGAKMTLAGPVASITGLSISTNLTSGQLSVTASQQGTYMVTYEGAYGSAVSAATEILVQAVSPPGTPQQPVTLPSTVLLHGQYPATINVLQADYDPAGGLLTVVGVSSPQGIEATIVQGEYLRIEATTPTPPNDQVVTYQVTNGTTAPVNGQVTVLWAAPIEPPTPPVVPPTYAVVRAGDEVDVPVLASANDPDGESVYMLPGGSPTSVGVTATNPGSSYIGGLGAASVSGSELRYAAPPAASVTSPESITVSFVVESQDGARTTGQTFVTVNPVDPATDNPPDPVQVDARVTAGGTITVPIPTTGVDPDGDTVAVTGIDQPPQLGRVLSVQANSITYQAYPLSGGTDTFTCQVEDPFGLTGQAIVQVGVTPPAQAQAPIAVDEYVTGAPGSLIDVNILASDIVAPGGQVTVLPLGKTNATVPANTKIVGAQQDLQVQAPQGAQPTTITYGITDGIASPSLAQVIVRSEPGYRTPPVAVDYFPPAPAAAAKTITVNVLAKDSDPTGPSSDLSVVAGFNPTVTVTGPNLVIPVSPFPHAVPYEIVSSASGAKAIGVVHVLGTAVGPQLRAGQLIQVPENGSATINIDTYITDATHPVQLTTTAGVSSSPTAGLTERVVSATTIQLRGLSNYDGPGSLTVQVTDGTALSDKQAHTGVFSLSVQVGRPTPVLRCPNDPIDVVEGGQAVGADIASVCQVWTPNGASPDSLTYTASWAKATPDVSLGWQGAPGHVISLAAESGAKGGTTGRIALGVSGYGATADSSINVEVVEAPLASVAAINVAGVETGHTATIDLDQYVTSPLAQPDITILSVHQTSTGGAQLNHTTNVVTITPDTGTHGQMTFSVQLTDAPDQPQRAVTGEINVQVLDSPGVPPSLQGVPGSDQVSLSWGAAPDNGAPISYYQVAMGGQTRQVPGTAYTWTGLTNGQTYSFTVTAVNQVGPSHQSISGSFAPRGVPNAPSGVSATGGNEQASLQWSAPNDNGEPITGYTVSVSPAPGTGSTSMQVGAQTSLVWHGLNNARGPYTFTIIAHNSVGPSPSSPPSNSVYSFGTPSAPPAPTVSASVSPNQTTTSIAVTWPAISECNVAEPCSSYVVTELNGGSSSGTQTVAGDCSSCSANFLNLSNNGDKYTYELEAVGYNHLTSPQSPPSQAIVAHGIPAQITNLTATPGDTSANVQFSLPLANGASIANVDYTATGGGSPVTGSWTNPGSTGAQVSESIPNLVNGTPYSITVVACNSENLCGSPSNTATADPYGTPYPPTVTAASTDNGPNTTVTYTWTGNQPTDNGRPIADYYLCFNGATPPCNNEGANPSSTSQNFNCTSNQQTETVDGYVITTVGEQSQLSVQQSAPVNPCAAPTAPTLTASGGSNTITWTWSGGGSPDSATANYYFCLSGQACVPEGPGPGSTVTTPGCQQSQSATAYVIDLVGQQGPSTGASTSTGGCSVQISQGGYSPQPSYCKSKYCDAINISIANFVPNATYTFWYSTNCQTWLSGGIAECGTKDNYASGTIGTNGAGAASIVGRSFGWPGASVWITMEQQYPAGISSNTVAWAPTSNPG